MPHLEGGTHIGRKGTLLLNPLNLLPELKNIEGLDHEVSHVGGGNPLKALPLPLLNQGHEGKLGVERRNVPEQVNLLPYPAVNPYDDEIELFAAQEGEHILPGIGGLDMKGILEDDPQRFSHTQGIVND